jgi:DNA-binding transcriptional MerR regulator
LIEVEYRTLHTWIGHGLLAASHEQASGSGTRNVFDCSDALEAYVLADLRRAGVELSKLRDVAAELRLSRAGRGDGEEVLLINGSVKIARRDEMVDAVARCSPTLVYDLAHAQAGLDRRMNLSE